MEEILRAESEALMKDKICLEEVKKEIDGITPKTTISDNAAENEICMSYSSANTRGVQDSNRSTAKKCNNKDERLKKLKEERDALLKTGSYTINDTIIAKLNAEIRCLMLG